MSIITKGITNCGDVAKLEFKNKYITPSNVEKLKELFPNIVSESKIDFEKLKQELSAEILDNTKEKYELTWYGKKEAIITANTPIAKTLSPIRKKSVDFDKTKNIYIEGDNLEALKILQESYLNKINIIYIDPPYNTGNDFFYNDKFAKTENEELVQSGQIDDDGNRLIANSISNGKFHSDWLSMIYPRLKIARNLLKDDGIIFISINDIEQANLKKICDEIFGEKNFIAQIVWTNKEGGGGSDTKLIKVKHEYILCYSKLIDKVTINGVKVTDLDRYNLEDKWVETRGKYQRVKLDSASLGYVESLDYPITAPDGSKIFPNKNGEKISRWRWSKEKLDWGIKNDYLEIKKDKTGKWNVYSKQYLNADIYGNIVERTNRPFAVIDKYSSTQASEQLQKLLNGEFFYYSKPTELIKYLLKISTKSNDLVLDFFSGSATTAQAVLELNVEDNENRKYIMIQFPEKYQEFSEAYKKGYKNICDIGLERIRSVSKKIKEETNADIDYGFRVYKVDSSNMKDVFYTPDELKQEQLSMFETNIKEDRTPEDLLTQVILDLGLTLDLKIEEKQIKNNKVYFVDNNKLAACFDDKINIDIINDIVEINPKKILFKESSFQTDSEKINIFERIKKLLPQTDIIVI